MQGRIVVRDDHGADRTALAAWFAPALSVGLLAWVGAIDPKAFPGVNAVACAIGAGMFFYSARNSIRSGLEGTAICHAVAGLVLATYAVLNALLTTDHLSELAFVRVSRPLFPLLITAVEAGPVMFRRWRGRKVDDMVAEYRRLSDAL